MEQQTEIDRLNRVVERLEVQVAGKEAIIAELTTALNKAEGIEIPAHNRFFYYVAFEALGAGATGGGDMMLTRQTPLDNFEAMKGLKADLGKAANLADVRITNVVALGSAYSDEELRPIKVVHL